MSVADAPLHPGPEAASPPTSSPATARPALAPVSLAARRAGALGMAALPGLSVVYLSFNAGGFFPGPTAVVMAGLALVLLLRVALVAQPFAGFSRGLLAASLALGGLAVWTLASSAWSGSPARALLNFDLVAVYLLVLVLMGASGRTRRRVRWTVGLTWLAMLAVCSVAVATRLRPDLFPVPLNMSPNRLAYPLTYWNALGQFAVMGMLLGIYLAASTREAALTRILGAAATPVFAVTILLTFSRAAWLLAPVAVVAFALLARPRGLLSALAAAGPASAIVLLDTYHAQLIANADVTPAAVVQGRHLASVLLLCCLAAGLIRGVLLALDRRLLAIPLTRRRRRRARVALAAGCALGALALLVSFGGTVSHQLSNFTKSDVSGGNDVRSRVANIRIGGRLEGWRIALKAFDQSPLRGHGAGTFANDWYRYRTDGGTALQTHSLYLQMLGELGVVGLALLVAGLGVLLGACFLRSRGSPARSLWIALGVMGAVWAIHAAVDWDWQMPAVTLPVFALGAGALARRGAPLRLRGGVDLGLRVLVGLLALGLAVTGARVAVSDARLSASVNAFELNSCPAATHAARASLAALNSRPQPWAVLGYCDLHHGQADRAVGEMQAAVQRDPQNWRYVYGLAVAEAGAGRDPRAQMQQALALDPLEPMIQAEVRALGGHSRRRWQRAAQSAPMPVSLRQ